MSNTLPSPNIVLYGNGLFEPNEPAANQLQLAALQTSGFTTVILWTIHVSANGDLVYNGDAPIVSGGTFNSGEWGYLVPLVSGLKASGSTVQKVLFSIGSGEVDDFTHIQALLATPAGTKTLTDNFGALADALPLDGFDFDDEDNYNVDTVATLTGILSQNGNGSTIITYCPYERTAFWVQCLQKVYALLGTQPVQAFNLQEYGGAGNPATWAAAVQSPTSGGSTGVSNGAAFVVPGFSAGTQSGQMTPQQIQSTFAGLTKSDAGVDGGMIWNLSQINEAQFSPAQYASAISDGLSGRGAAAVA